MDEPTRGIDIGAKAEFHALMGQLAGQGIGILMISSEMPEIMGMSDRVIVMCQGRVTGEFKRGELSQVEIMTSAAQYPRKDWLEFVASARARSKIRHALRAREKERGRELGREILDRDLRKAGLSVDYQTMDWGSVIRRLDSREPPERGGWSAYFSSWAGLDHINPAGHLVLRGNGRSGFVGWPESTALEALREAWFEAATLEEQKRIAADIQRQAMQDVPYIPLGQYFLPMAHRRTVAGVSQPGGIPLFWGVTVG